MAASNLPGGGPAPLLLLRTIPPLPHFRIPHGVPNDETPISSFKLAVLRILTGQTVSSSSTKPLTFSEELKEKTINGWRMQMLMLELRQAGQQNGDASSSTTSSPTDPNAATAVANEPVTGFELQDDHDCSLLEEGDEIVVRLKPGHQLKDLQLPDLKPGHRYSAPAGSLTRAGTLSAPPPYSVATPAEPSSHSSSVAAQPNANYHQHCYHDYRQGFRVLTAKSVGGGRIRRAPVPAPINASPANANSSTNVSGAAEAAAAGAAAAAAPSGGYSLGSAGLGGGLNMVSSGTKTNGAKRPAAKKDRSSSVAAATQGKPVYKRIVSSSAIATAESTPPASPVIASTPTTLSLGLSGGAPAGTPRITSNSRRNSSSTATQSQQQPQSQQTHSGSGAGVAVAAGHNNGQSSLSSVAFGNGKAAGQASMPSTALVIGPGVQGTVGRNANSAATPMGSSGGAAIAGEDYGNASAFVGFAAASGELRSRPKRQLSRHKSDEGDANGTGSAATATATSRRPSNPASAAVDAAERRIAAAKAAQIASNGEGNTARPARERQASAGSSNAHPQRQQPRLHRHASSPRLNRVELPTAPFLPPIQNLAPIPTTPSAFMPEERKERDLPPMPSTAAAPSASAGASGAPSPALSRNYISEASQLPSMGNVQRPGQGSFFRRFSTKSQGAVAVGAGTATSPVTTPSATTPLDEASSPLREQFDSLALVKGDDSAQAAGGGAGGESGVSTAKLTRAERRYAEIQRSLAKEREKQAEAERLRREEYKLADEKRTKEQERKEAEARHRAEERKWEIWEEVRKRQKNGAPANVPPPIAGNAGAALPSPPPPMTAAAAVASRAAPPERSGSYQNGQASASTSTPPPTVARAVATSSSAAAPAAATAPLAPASGPQIELGLSRITSLLHRLGSPHRHFPVIHVAGTNGKGSTIAYLDTLLRNALDVRTGTFVSPHLVERRDSVHVNGRVIAKDVWRLALADVLEADQGLDLPSSRRGPNDDGGPLKASPFELLTAQAFQAFHLMEGEERPEILLIEVGLGGRLDATNVFDPSQVLASVICPIARDHEAFLGSDLVGIAREKAGIIKQEGLVIVADQRGSVDAAESERPTAGGSGGGGGGGEGGGGEGGGGETMNQTAFGPLSAETTQLGSRVAGILDAIRSVCMERSARFVKGSVPLSLLGGSMTSSRPSLSAPPHRPGALVTFRPWLGPTLSLSTSGFNPPTTFVAHPGDPSIPGPLLTIEKTRANILACSTAIQTLWSVGRDDPTLEGRSDRWQEVRTKILWGLRDEDVAKTRVKVAGEETTWKGRCSWISIDEIPHRTKGDKGKKEKQEWILVDGSHNVASILALKEYIEDLLILQDDAKKEEEKMKWLFAFTKGKEYISMMKTLFSTPLLVSSCSGRKHEIGITRFEKPEGMNWIESVQPTLEVVQQVEESLRSVGVDVHVLSLSDTKQGLEWLTDGGKGWRVVTGSLYLVGEVFKSIHRDE